MATGDAEDLEVRSLLQAISRDPNWEQKIKNAVHEAAAEVGPDVVIDALCHPRAGVVYDRPIC